MLYTVRFLQTLCMSFKYTCTFILYYIYIQYIHLTSVTLLQNDQNREHIQKSRRFFFVFFVFIFFCFAEYKYVACLLNQYRQLTNGRNVYSKRLFLAKVPSVKYVPECSALYKI